MEMLQSCTYIRYSVWNICSCFFQNNSACRVPRNLSICPLCVDHCLVWRHVISFYLQDRWATNPWLLAKGSMVIGQRSCKHHINTNRVSTSASNATDVLHLYIKPCSDQFILRKHNNISAFSIIFHHRNGAASWNSSSLKTWTSLSCAVNIMAADDLVIQGARASTTYGHGIYRIAPAYSAFSSRKVEQNIAI